MTPRQRGHLAAEQGQPITACPYTPGSEEGVAWRQGWLSRPASASTFAASPESGKLVTPLERAS